MSRRSQRRREKEGLELLDEALHLLRLAPLRVPALYAIGAIPFVLGWLYFWADMSRSAFAARHVAPASFGLAVLFVWMKSWQAAFAGELQALVARQAAPAWTFRRVVRLAVVQTVIQPWGLVLIPLSMLLLIPFPAAYACFQNVTVCGDGQSTDLRALMRRSVRQAGAWPMQNAVIIWLASPWLVAVGMLVAFGGAWLAVSLTPDLYEMRGVLWFGLALVLMFATVLPLAPLGCVVAGNVALVLAILPSAWQAITGSTGLYTLSGFHGILNTTFLMTVFALTYLGLDPLVKAAYVLRDFAGESRQSGDYLLAELRSIQTDEESSSRKGEV